LQVVARPSSGIFFFKKKKINKPYIYQNQVLLSLSLSLSLSVSVSVVFMLFFSWPGHTESKTTSVELKSKLVKIVLL
jgi:hypothetical protein